MFRFKKIVDELKHAFATDSGKLTDDEIALIEKLADYVVRRKMTVPAIMFLESVEPLNFIGNQAGTFFQPIITNFFPAHEYNRFITLLEKREALKMLIRKIEKRVKG
ncbi:MAG: hypothetical protein D8M57_13305 [Candidatus Scalindua sp. AMX11]|nr:MAG: hypothetical protein DWQ00_11785 [Candidatus Scalindua sp.]NOG83749.1 hypothetical protein [Planctomycetota bacterium]RZV82908.1 MAG: hypothetical protein EX341_08940 [Candidatus Scalindua sp. SCAELEC01]TDE64470.1 MAG: hypothetical protein D8M57_13305 [Candidatus Scalindua sp. AMX11]GJQ59799.1 MAG: hypothetical protein SCALA701_26000 [Candidatus Scalindua sp.]